MPGVRSSSFTDALAVTDRYSRSLPAIEVVATGTLASSERKSDQPHESEDRGCDPQHMECESSAEQDQDNE
jgi:hypothetical protein